MPTFTNRFLTADAPEDVRALQRVHSRAPGYNLIVFGHMPDGTGEAIVMERG